MIVPVLNEDRFIQQKLRDLQATDYVDGRLNILVVDGGSSDRTMEYAAEFEADTWPVEILHANSARGKADQVNAALEHVDTEFVVLTDVDTTLEPVCIHSLVEALRNDPGCAIMGARVVPLTDLAEERFHWQIVNAFWHLEGEAFGAAAVSGVCHALRPALFGNHTRLLHPAEDVELTMLARRRGYRSRTNPAAIGYEHRVPRSIGEMILFRRRRARDYRQVLNGIATKGKSACAWMRLDAIRLFQMGALPCLALIMLVSGALLTALGWSILVLVIVGVFTISMWWWLDAISRDQGRWRRLIILLRWGAVVGMSLFSLFLSTGSFSSLDRLRQPLADGGINE